MKRLILTILLAITLITCSVSATAFSSWSYAAGCWTASNDTHTLVMWNAPGDFSYPLPSGVNYITILQQAGGASGGLGQTGVKYDGGGGAAGGLNYTVNMAVVGGNTYFLSVGDGGASQNTDGKAGNRGGNTTWGDSIAIGGGRGGGNTEAAGNGGSGGGASATGTKGLGTSGQGYDGGADTFAAGNNAGGGGGVGGVGADTPAAASGGNGGTGVYIRINDTSVPYGDGGGGFGYTTKGLGGALGTGGNGGDEAITEATSGVPGTGGGGGGSSRTGHPSGAGAHGRLVIKFPTPSVSSAFTANTTTPYVNDYVGFTDLSLGSPSKWDWNFGDGTANVTTQNPSHQYTAAGTYSVWLNASSSSSYDVEYKIGYITVSPVPAPTAPSFIANKSYSTNTTLDVMFTATSAAPVHLQYSNLSTGDGGWVNKTGSSFVPMNHSYTSPGTYTVTLYVTNDVGTASTTTNEMIVVSTPVAELLSNPTSINYGIPQNITLRIHNVSHLNNAMVNVTFNKSVMEVLNVYEGANVTDWLMVATIDNGNGFASINMSNTNKSYLMGNDFAILRVNVTKNGVVNTSEPINLVANTGVIPATQYTQELFPYFIARNTTVKPTDATFTQTFVFYRTDTDALMNTIQITNTWTGITSGSAFTTTGSQAVSSKWGYINLSSTASAFYSSDLYAIEITGGTTNVYMTPFTPDTSGKINVLYPHEVRIMVVDKYGNRLKSVTVDAVMVNSTTYGTNWFEKLFGISTSATPIEGTWMNGTTDSYGSVIFPMVGSGDYQLMFRNALLGINQTERLHPDQVAYTIVVQTTGTQDVPDMADYITYALTTLDAAPNVYLNMSYVDTLGETSDVLFYVNFPNQTSAYSKMYQSFSGSNQTVNASYAVSNVKGAAYVWGFAANNTQWGFLNQSQGITLKGATGVIYNPFEYHGEDWA